MDERTSVLVCLAAAVSANCVALLDYYHGKALHIGLDTSDIGDAVALGVKVKTGANIPIMTAVDEAARHAHGTSAVASRLCTEAG